MRYLILICILFSQLFALNIKTTYKKAQEFEKSGDVKNAMIWYKKIADLSMPINEKDLAKSIANTDYIKDEINSVKEVRKVYKKYFAKSQDKQTDQSVEQVLTGIFGVMPYRTNYLLPVIYNTAKRDGRKHFETEFQISFKKDVFSNLLGFDERYAFGYTQTSWWQTFKKSKPFRETNYRPEVFVYGFYKSKNFPLKGYKLGLIHESNGRDGDISRSWNRIYLTSFWQIGNVFVNPRIWYRIPEPDKEEKSDDFGDDNPDIEKYLGHGDLNLLYPYKKHIFKAKLRNNLRFNSQNKGSAELEWTFPLHSKNFFGYLKLFTGYGNSLEDYDIYTNRIGLGFAFSR